MIILNETGKNSTGIMCLYLHIVSSFSVSWKSFSNKCSNESINENHEENVTFYSVWVMSVLHCSAVLHHT